MSLRKDTFRLGILVPSSNTALEPLTYHIVSSLDSKVSVHFSRFTVTHISLSAEAVSQFDLSKIVAAAQLLADAKVDVIGWSGTSGGWLGFDQDEELCNAITQATGGIPATTSTLALNKAFAAFGCSEFGLVTPYSDDVQDKIIQTYKESGFSTLAESHLGISDNHEIGEVEVQTLDKQVDNVVSEGAKVVTTFCTNLRAAQRVEFWEQKYGVLVFDTVAVVVWHMLKIVGCDTRQVRGWGRMFEA